jgi:hypothetical protein
VTQGKEIRGNVTRKHEIQGNVNSEKRNSGKHVFGEICFRGNGSRGNDNTGNRTIPIFEPVGIGLKAVTLHWNKMERNSSGKSTLTRNRTCKSVETTRLSLKIYTFGCRLFNLFLNKHAHFKEHTQNCNFNTEECDFESHKDDVDTEAEYD